MKFNFRPFAASLFLAVILLLSFGFAQVYAITPTILAVVKGLSPGDGIYYQSWFNGWSSGWTSLMGQTPSAPVLCQTFAGSGGLAELIVRGTNNGIYHKEFTSGAWSSSWDSPGGATIDEPACEVVFNGAETVLYLVVRGTDNGIYFNSMRVNCSGSGCNSWSGWVSLGGATLSAPAIAAPDDTRIDVFVRGTNNGLWHRSADISSNPLNPTWENTWDNLGGVTYFAPFASEASEFGAATRIFVEGTNTGVYQGGFSCSSTPCDGTLGLDSQWSGWTQWSTYESPFPASVSQCSAKLSVAVIGGNNGLYGTPSIQDYPQLVPAGGTTFHTAAVTSVSSLSESFVLVVGTNNGVYFNIQSSVNDGWTGFAQLPGGGATDASPAIAVVPCG